VFENSHPLCFVGSAQSALIPMQHREGDQNVLRDPMLHREGDQNVLRDPMLHREGDQNVLRA